MYISSCQELVGRHNVVYWHSSLTCSRVPVVAEVYGNRPSTLARIWIIACQDYGTALGCALVAFINTQRFQVAPRYVGSGVFQLHRGDWL